MHTSRIPKTPQSSSAIDLKNERTSTPLQKILLCAILMTTLLLVPAAAVPTIDSDDTLVLWECKNPKSHLGKYVKLSLPPNETFLVPSAGRELKLRASQKKQIDAVVGCSGHISTTGDVFFSNSPVVTGLHLPDGVTGRVCLQTRLETSRPAFCTVYTIFELSLENYPVGSETLVKYTLPLSKIEEEGYNPADITLCIYEDAVWRNLYTVYFTDYQNAYFESVTTSLGTFAIVFGEYEVGSSSDARHHIDMKHTPPVRVAIAPACFVTHPVSYTAIV